MQPLLEPLLERLVWIMGYAAIPCVWIETLLFWILGFDASTSFRMFLPRDIDPQWPAGAVHTFALLMVMHIPFLVSSEERADGGSTLGTILRPLTKRASLSVVCCIMFVRVWLLVACANAATAQFFTDYRAGA